MKKNIVLIGLTGCGKSTVGKRLATKLKLPFVDMDDYIEEQEKMPIREIFATHGEPYFRERETEAAKALSERDGCVIATGGGAILNPKNMEYLKKTGVVLFIDRTPEMILKKLDVSNRPMLAADPTYLYKLSAQRRPLYETYADVTLSGTHGIWRATNKATRLVKKYL